MKFSKTERVLHAFAVVALLLLLLIILFGQTVKDSGPAEWLSALLNLVMAGAAVAAYLTARSWLPQLTTQEGYKLAISLVNKDVLTLGDDNPLKNNLYHAVEAFMALKDKERLVTGETVLQGLQAVYQQADSQIRNIQKLEKQMATYGLVPAPDRAKAFSAMLDALKDFRAWTLAQWVLLSVVARGGVESGKLSDLQDTDHHGMIASMAADTVWTDLSAENQAKLDTAWEKMTAQQKKFLGKDSRIGKLFVVKK